MKLFRQAPCPHCETYIEKGTRGIGCIGCHQTGKVYVEVSPADLELGAVEVLGKLKKYLSHQAKAPKTEVYEFCEHLLQCMIPGYESGLNLGEMRKLREKARAWELVSKGLDRQAEKVLIQARAELETEGKEKGGEKKCST
ncbi:MAG: hypothetical protein IMF11_20255 [Proteobacteria bacterium]|nr:hypothetical protein [Pseudomonadota bacterium]